MNRTNEPSATTANAIAHESTPHEDAQTHHHHSHAAGSHHEGGHHLLQVEDLSVTFRMYESDAPFFKARQREVRTIENLSISVHAGEVVAVVGASGSGKTLLADAVFGLFEPNATVEGRVWFDGERQDAASLASLRGNGISLVPQSVTHLDPLMPVGRQVRGAAKTRAERAERTARQRALFERYGLGSDVEGLYPHELSGGMARRVLLCCALMDDPKLIVADEPTPGLDLDLAVRALDDLRAFADEGGGVLLITHDIELALRVADRVAVFKDGTVVEETAVASFARPDLLRHPFTRELWHALPEHDFAVSAANDGGETLGERSSEMSSWDGERPANAATVRVRAAGVATIAMGTSSETAAQAPNRALEVRNVSFSHDGRHSLFNGISLAIAPGERVALTAPSGFGKTTLCRILAGYEKPTAGRVLVDGVPLPRTGACPVQLIGQHPETAVDPRVRLRDTLEEAGPIDEALCEALGIKRAWLRRYPHELSGGELQRFCIARALAVRPRYLIADEISTMLDAVTQAQLWEFLLAEVQEHSLGLLFVSHVPALTERVATRTIDLVELANRQ